MGILFYHLYDLCDINTWVRSRRRYLRYLAQMAVHENTDRLRSSLTLATLVESLLFIKC